MTELRPFYKKLDFLLNKISRGKTDAGFLTRILSEMENIFGEAIRIANGRIYELQGEEYVLIHPPANDTLHLPETLPADSEALELVVRYSTYIYDNPRVNLFRRQEKEIKKYVIPAAFTVTGKKERWIIFFELKSEWNREEVEFCFNAVGTALNYRLFAEGMKDDLEQAAAIQQSLLPEVPPDIPGFQIAFRSEASEFVVGDLYDFFRNDEDYFGVCLGDARGHGFPAALLVRDIVTGLRLGLEKEMKIVHTIKKLNRVINRSSYSTRFVSLIYCEIENDGNLIYVNAGHPPGLLINGKRIDDLKATGIVIGFLEEIKLRHVCGHIKPGGVLLLYTDGITERTNPGNQEFGITRLKELILKHQDKGANELVEAIFESVYAFGNREKWKDDATVVVIKRTSDSLHEEPSGSLPPSRAGEPETMAESKRNG